MLDLPAFLPRFFRVVVAVPGCCVCTGRQRARDVEVRELAQERAEALLLITPVHLRTGDASATVAKDADRERADLQRDAEEEQRQPVEVRRVPPEQTRERLDTPFRRDPHEVLRDQLSLSEKCVHGDL
jgi:hypothetical protein